MSLVVVLADTNVLYSRVLRDYFMYAAQRQVIAIKWSQAILDELTRNLIEKNQMTAEQAKKLEKLTIRAQPKAIIEVRAEHFTMFADIRMPDPDDRKILAAAEAEYLCTANLKHFPNSAMNRVGFELIKPGALLVRMFSQNPEDMLWAHEQRLRNLPSTTNEQTIKALAGAAGNKAAECLQNLLRTPKWDYDTRGGDQSLTATSPLTGTSKQEMVAGSITCRYCPRKLRKAKSIALGYGPRCAKQYKLPY